MFKIDLRAGYYKLLGGINVLIGFLLLLSLLILARDIISMTHRRAEKPAPSFNSGSQGFDRRDLQGYEVILRHNPFGFSAGSLKPLSTTGKAVSDLTLIGTVSGPRMHSYAIFADSNGRQDVFRVDEPVFGSGRLERVDRDKVFIRGNSGLIEIAIAEIATIKEVYPSDSTRRTSDLARNIGNGTYIVDQKKILDALNNPGQLMTDARLQPNFTDGRQEGFVLREVRNGGIYQNLGLQNGDVLLRINDYNISNPENALQAFTALRGMDRVHLDIVRNGVRMTMTYQIR
ncbi:MAG: type II secretion system protein GspC [Thermodesulfovibrionales bacterium]